MRNLPKEIRRIIFSFISSELPEEMLIESLKYYFKYYENRCNLSIFFNPKFGSECYCYGCHIKFIKKEILFI